MHGIISVANILWWIIFLKTKHTSYSLVNFQGSTQRSSHLVGSNIGKEHPQVWYKIKIKKHTRSLVLKAFWGKQIIALILKQACFTGYAQTLLYVTPPTGKIQKLRKIAITFKPLHTCLQVSKLNLINQRMNSNGVCKAAARFARVC